MEYLLHVRLIYSRILHCIVTVTDLKTLAIVTMLIYSDNIYIVYDVQGITVDLLYRYQLKYSVYNATHKWS